MGVRELLLCSSRSCLFFPYQRRRSVRSAAVCGQTNNKPKEVLPVLSTFTPPYAWPLSPCHLSPACLPTSPLEEYIGGRGPSNQPSLLATTFSTTSTSSSQDHPPPRSSTSPSTSPISIHVPISIPVPFPLPVPLEPVQQQHPETPHGFRLQPERPSRDVDHPPTAKVMPPS